jgi:hypothetical protein
MSNDETFSSQSQYWQLPQIEALLTSVPKDKMIILDLYSTAAEQYTRLEIESLITYCRFSSEIVFFIQLI